MSHPVISLSTTQLQGVILYCIMAERLLSVERPFQRETLRHLSCCLYTDLVAIFTR